MIARLVAQVAVLMLLLIVGSYVLLALAGK